MTCNIFLRFYYLHMCVCVHGHMGTNAYGGQKGASEFLDLEFQVVVCHLMWVLRAELGSSLTLAAEPSVQPPVMPLYAIVLACY